MPIELKFAKPQSAKVAIVKERGSSACLHRAEALERDQFIRHHAQAEQIADGVAVVPGNADHPRDRRKKPAENLLDARGKPATPTCASPL